MEGRHLTVKQFWGVLVQRPHISVFPFSGCFSGGVHWVSIGKQDKSGLLMKLQNLCTRLGQEESFSQRLPLNIEEAKDRLRVLMLRKHPRYGWSNGGWAGLGWHPESSVPFPLSHCFPVVLSRNLKKKVATTWSKLPVFASYWLHCFLWATAPVLRITIYSWWVVFVRKYKLSDLNILFLLDKYRTRKKI